MANKKIKRALVSVFEKRGLSEIVKSLIANDIEIVSTGGTQAYINSLGYDCTPVEELTNFASIFGGRVKTLHPAIFGGILMRRDNEEDAKQSEMYDISPIDLVIVDLYPFEETLKSGAEHQAIIEKIDIGGVSLIRAAAKNYKDVVIIPSQAGYGDLMRILDEQNGETSLEDRRALARKAFEVTAHYDSAIRDYFIDVTKGGESDLTDDNEADTPGHLLGHLLEAKCSPLRYGENPHQKGFFCGSLEDRFTFVQGKQLSYNNLLDVDVAMNLIGEFDQPACAILKHNTPCGLAVANDALNAYKEALSCDPVSAFGGIIVLNGEVTEELAKEIDNIFYEVLIAPSYSDAALELLQKKSKRILLIDKHKGANEPHFSSRTVLNGMLVQEFDTFVEKKSDLQTVTIKEATEAETNDMLFGMRAVKYCKSNAIVLAKDGKMIGAGFGQTSRVDALKQAIEKAKAFELDLKGAVMASDAFFPFADCVEIAHNAGITAVVQPGGSIKDQASIDYCNEHEMAMCFTGHRHFRH